MPKKAMSSTTHRPRSSTGLSPACGIKGAELPLEIATRISLSQAWAINNSE